MPLVNCPSEKKADNTPLLLGLLLSSSGTRTGTTTGTGVGTTTGTGTGTATGTGTGTATGTGTGTATGTGTGTATGTGTGTGTATPTITNFSPAFGVTGTVVTITGTNFSTTAANNTVRFNGTTATVNSATSTSLNVTAPTGVTTGTITVTVNGLTATTTSNFDVSPWTNLSANVPVTSDIYRISCPTANTCFALAQADSTSNTSFIRTTDGGANWTSFNSGYSILSSTTSLAGGISCPDTSTCYIAGSNSSSNKILKVTNASAVTPTITQMGNTGFYRSISCPTTTFCIAVGTNTAQRTTDGTNWTSINTSNTMVTVHCLDTTTCYGAEANTKTVYKTTNASTATPTWATQTIPSGTSIYSIHCVDATNCMAVGNTVLAKTTDGTTWTSLTMPSASGSSSIMNGVHCFDANTCTIAGNSTSIWRTSNGGTNWTNQGFGATNNILGLACSASPSSACYVTLTAGNLLKRSSN